MPQALAVGEDMQVPMPRHPDSIYTLEAADLKSLTSAYLKLLALRLSMVLVNQYLNVELVVNTTGSDPTTFPNII